MTGADMRESVDAGTGANGNASVNTDANLGVDTAIAEESALIAIFERVMGIASVSGEEQALADYAEQLLRACHGFSVHRDGDTVVAISHWYDAASQATSRQSVPRIILAGHLDTVPIIDNFPPVWLAPGDARILPEIAQRYPHDRVMFGRGATDMKASDAVLLRLAQVLASRATHAAYEVTIVLYDHEEVAAQYNGLRRVIEHHPDWLQGDFAIIGEPTSNGIEGGCNGTLRFDVITHGVAAHSARSWMGHNAIHDAAEVLRRLQEYQPQTINVEGLAYREGLNATMIAGGSGTNIIPQECRVHVNYRFAPDKTIAQAKALMMGADAQAQLGNGEHMASGGVFQGFGVLMHDESPAAKPGLSNPLVVRLVEVVRAATGLEPAAKLGWTDVARFSQLGIPAVNLGAGSPLLAHKADEQIACSELGELERILLAWLDGLRAA